MTSGFTLVALCGLLGDDGGEQRDEPTACDKCPIARADDGLRGSDLAPLDGPEMLP
jgi:hypothetical protein